MARSLVAALTLLSMTIRPASAQDASAQEIPEDIVTAADEAGVDPVDLAGAVATTSSDPYEYLYNSGEFKRPAPPVPQFTIWDQLAQCESSGNWAANTNNGYYGGIQFDLDSWHRAGGTGYPNQASRATQIAVGQRWQSLVGWGAWPVCSRKLGLR